MRARLVLPVRRELKDLLVRRDLRVLLERWDLLAQ